MSKVRKEQVSTLCPFLRMKGNFPTSPQQPHGIICITCLCLNLPLARRMGLLSSAYTSQHSVSTSQLGRGPRSIWALITSTKPGCSKKKGGGKETTMAEAVLGICHGCLNFKCNLLLHYAFHTGRTLHCSPMLYCLLFYFNPHNVGMADSVANSQRRKLRTKETNISKWWQNRK